MVGKTVQVGAFTVTVDTSPRVRYQILFGRGTRKDENFTARQKAAFDARCEQLRNEQATFWAWDTQRSAAKVFRS